MLIVKHTERAPARGRHSFDDEQPKRVFSCAGGACVSGGDVPCGVDAERGRALGHFSRTILGRVAQLVERRHPQTGQSLTPKVAGSSPALAQFTADDPWRRVGENAAVSNRHRQIADWLPDGGQFGRRLLENESPRASLLRSERWI